MSIASSTAAGPHRAPAKWTASQVAQLDTEWQSPPVITEQDFARTAPDIDIWDAWPIQTADGMPADFDGSSYWMALGSQRFADPSERHSHARIHLFRQREDGWLHLGPAMPDGFSPGSREWSGSAVLEPDRRTVQLYFTAAGRRGETKLTFEQRIFQATGTLHPEGIKDWRDLREIVMPHPDHYMRSDAGSGAIGTIKAFRDPAYFLDPKDGRHYLFFAASLAGSASDFNGVVGAASGPPGAPHLWTILPPILSADTLNNELERPHVVFHQGLYYLFWSTQEHVFNPAGPVGPTGLYGMASPALDGEWQPLNGTALVFANPSAAPKQAYSWLVLPDLSVISFVDQWGLEKSQADGSRFGASFAPLLHLRLDGLQAELAV